MPRHPTCFVSYSWDSDQHKAWVRGLATRLRRDGVDVVLDQWDAVPGDQIPQFMEAAVRDNDYVLVVCTPRYKDRSDRRTGGVGYEGDIITGEVFVGRNYKEKNRKVIPILREGSIEAAAPSFCLGKYYINLSSYPYSEERYKDLLDTLLDRRQKAPPLGSLGPELLRQVTTAEARDTRIWYELEQGSFPVLRDSSSARGAFLGPLRDSLVSSFGNRPVRFAIALKVDSIESEGHEVPFYVMWSSQRAFVFSAAKLHKDFTLRIIEARLSARDRQRARESLRREVEQHERENASWTINAELVFDRFPRAHWIDYDPSIERIQIKVDRHMHADPKQYDNHVETASEALVYACALAGQPVVLMGDIAWQMENFALHH
jgi:TIR domain